MPVKVKICGITSPEDARVAAEAGADLVGLMFWEDSPRFITEETASAIHQALPPQVLRVGVFVNPGVEEVFRAISAAGLNMVQFHGEESPEFCTQFMVMSMKAFRVKDAGTLDELVNYPTDAWLLDAYVAGRPGGTGETFNWDLAVQATSLGRPVFLAGGLTPENVGLAVERVEPFGVDVSSGVESAPGKKDPDKVRRFVQAAKSVPVRGF